MVIQYTSWLHDSTSYTPPASTSTGEFPSDILMPVSPNLGVFSSPFSRPPSQHLHFCSLPSALLYFLHQVHFYPPTSNFLLGPIFASNISPNFLYTDHLYNNKSRVSKSSGKYLTVTLFCFCLGGYLCRSTTCATSLCPKPLLCTPFATPSPPASHHSVQTHTTP